MQKIAIAFLITYTVIFANEVPSFDQQIKELSTSTWTVEINFPNRLIGPIVGGGGYKGPKRVMSLHFNPQQGVIAIFDDGGTETKHIWLWRKQSKTLHYLTETKNDKSGVKLLLPSNITSFAQANAILKKHHPKVFEFMMGGKTTANGELEYTTAPIESVSPNIFLHHVQTQFTGEFYQGDTGQAIFSKKDKTSGIFGDAQKVLYLNLNKKDQIFVLANDKDKHLLICVYTFQKETQVDINDKEIDKEFTDFAVKTLDASK